YWTSGRHRRELGRLEWVAVRDTQRLAEDGPDLGLVPMRVAGCERAHPHVQVGRGARIRRWAPLERKPPHRQTPPQRRGERLGLADPSGGGVLQERADDRGQLVCGHIERVIATQVRRQNRPGLVHECPDLVKERGFVRHGVRTLLPRMSPHHGVDPDRRSGGPAAPRRWSPRADAGATPKPRAAQPGGRNVTYRPSTLTMKTRPK